MGEARGGRDYYMPDLPEGGVCDTNARLVSMYVCANGSGATFGCLTVNGGQVPQVGQICSPLVYIVGTIPPVPVYYEIITVDPQNPNFIGNLDIPTVPGATACGYDCPPNAGGACGWAGGVVGQYPNWQDCDNAITAGHCFNPTYFCDDYNCKEIVYGATPNTIGLLSTEIDEVSCLNNIISITTTPAGAIHPVTFPYSDPGGVWDGLTTLGQIAATPGPSGYISSTNVGQGYSTVYSYNPLHYTIDDCINCCPGINYPTQANGAPNPFYDMSTFPTPHAGYAAYMVNNSYAQNSASFTQYLFTLGINSCGVNDKCPPGQC